MIISDFEEAMLYCVDASNNDIEKSNRKFGLFISKYLSTDYKLMAENVKNDYIDENNNGH